MYEFTLLKLAAIFFKEKFPTFRPRGKPIRDTLSSIIEHIEKLRS